MSALHTVTQALHNTQTSYTHYTSVIPSFRLFTQALHNTQTIYIHYTSVIVLGYLLFTTIKCSSMISTDSLTDHY